MQQRGGRAAIEASETGLVDRSLMVRFLAQRHLAAHGVDAAERYRWLLGTRPADAARGLAEVGSALDAPLLYPLLDSTRPGGRREAASTIGRLIGVDAEARLLQLLGDLSPSVARGAAVALVGFGPTRASIEAAWEAWRSASSEGTRRAALRILRSAGRWHQLRLACTAVADDDPTAQAMGLDLLDRCLARWNHTFTEPPTADLEDLRVAVAAARPRLSPPHADLLDMSVRRHLDRR